MSNPTSNLRSLASYDQLRAGTITAGFRTEKLGGDPALEIEDASAPGVNDWVCLSLVEAQALREWLNGILGAGETTAEPQRFMHIYAHPGTKVVFAYPDNGYEGDRAHAAKHLKVGETYTVSRTSVGQSNSLVYLREIEGTCFNTVQFAPEQVKSSREPCTFPDCGHKDVTECGKP